MITKNNNNIYMRFQIGDESVFLHKNLVENSLLRAMYYDNDLTDEMEIVYDQVIKEVSSWNYLPNMSESSELVYLLEIDTYFMKTVITCLTRISDYYAGKIENLYGSLSGALYVTQINEYNNTIDKNKTIIVYIARFNILCLLLKHFEIKIDKNILISLIDNIDNEKNVSTIVVGLHEFSLYENNMLQRGLFFVKVNKKEIIDKMRQLVENLSVLESNVSSRYRNIPQRLYKYDQPQSYTTTKTSNLSPKEGKFTTSRFL